MVVPLRSQARLRYSLLHWAYFALFRSTIRNSRLATLPLASLLCSLDFRFACFAHCARRSSVPLGARFVRPRHCHIHSSQWSSCIFAPCRLRRPGVSPLRTSLRSVSSGLQPLRGLRRAALPPLLLYKSPKTEAASRGAGQLIAKVVQWKGNGLTDHPKSFALATESVSQPSIVQRSICAGRVPSGTLESANR